jgi:tripartite-type tricarboxylate transporter receptor subunit TctC
VRKRLAELSAEPLGTSPSQMAAFMKQDTARWREVIRSASVKTE